MMNFHLIVTSDLRQDVAPDVLPCSSVPGERQLLRRSTGNFSPLPSSYCNSHVLKGVAMRVKTFLLLVAGAALATPAFAVDGFYVDSNTVSEVQRTLNQRGSARLGVDGKMGPRTQAAVREFQRSQRLEPTGQLNRQTLIALGLQRPDGSAAASEPRYSAAVVRRVQQTLAHRGFKVDPIDGQMHASTQQALRQFQKSENLEDTGRLNDRTLAALGIEPEAAPQEAARMTSAAGASNPAPSVRDAQHRLNRLGYNAGAEDGVMGQATRAALMEFQRAEGLPATGRLDRATIDALRSEGSVAAR
jgi:peptidoglycan hydrolase-like protein with peptidoglycan-binding domain